MTATVSVPAALVATTPLRRSLLWLGALCAALTLDDILLLHDAVLPGRGMAEGFVLTAYALAGIVLARWWWPLRRTHVGAAFFIGAGMLAVSVALDTVLGDFYVPEDGAKLLGVVAWGFCGAWTFSDALARLRTHDRRRVRAVADAAAAGRRHWHERVTADRKCIGLDPADPLCTVGALARQARAQVPGRAAEVDQPFREPW